MANRLNYYFRQKVSESELDSGFALMEEADQNLMLDMFQTGVLSGMVVTQRGAGANLTVDVSAGVTYDKAGQRIQFSSTQNVSVSVDESAVSTTVAGVGNSKIISLFAKFKRVLTDPRTDGNSVTVYFSEDESFEFIVRQGSEGVSPSPVALDTTYILLADITRIYGGTTIVNADIDTSTTNRREEVFKISGTPNRIQRGSVKDALSDILGWFNTASTLLDAHIADAVDAHDATAISYLGSGAWADASTVAASTVEAALDEVVSDLGATTGAVKVGKAAYAATAHFGLSAGSVGGALDALAAYMDIGPRGNKVRVVTVADTPVTVADADREIFVNTTGGAVSLNLPSPVTYPGRKLIVKDSHGQFGTNNCSLVRNGGESIEGVAATRVLAATWGSYVVSSNGTDWFLE